MSQNLMIHQHNPGQHVLLVVTIGHSSCFYIWSTVIVGVLALLIF